MLCLGMITSRRSFLQTNDVIVSAQLLSFEGAFGGAAKLMVRLRNNQYCQVPGVDQWAPNQDLCTKYSCVNWLLIRSFHCQRSNQILRPLLTGIQLVLAKRPRYVDLRTSQSVRKKCRFPCHCRQTPFSGYSLQFRVLTFGLVQDWNVRIGVLPEREEISISRQRSDAGGVGVRAVRSFGH